MILTRSSILLHLVDTSYFRLMIIFQAFGARPYSLRFDYHYSELSSSVLNGGGYVLNQRVFGSFMPKKCKATSQHRLRKGYEDQIALFHEAVRTPLSYIVRNHRTDSYKLTQVRQNLLINTLRIF